MNIVLAMLYIACYSAGLLSIYTLVVLYARERKKLYFCELIIMCALMGITINLSLYVLLSPADFVAMPMMAMMLGFLMAGGISLLTFAVPWYAEILRPGKSARIVRIFAGASSLALFVGWALFLLIAGINLLVFLFVPMLVCVAGALIWCFTVLIRRGPAVLQDSSFRAFAIIALVSLVMMPLVVLSDYMGMEIAAVGQPRHYVFLPVFYAIWAVLLLILRTPELFRPKPVQASALKVDAGRTPDSQTNPLFSRYEISEREYEVLVLLVEGFSYSHIAGRLFISHSTVKTHVASIYRKTGARGKVELANLVRGNEKTP